MGYKNYLVKIPPNIIHIRNRIQFLRYLIGSDTRKIRKWIRPLSKGKKNENC